MGGQAGILQGERRWTALAAVYLAMGVGRLAFGIVALVVEPDTLGAMVGVTVGAFAPVVVGWLVLRNANRERTAAPATATGPDQTTEAMSTGGLLREVFNNSHALLAFFALSNVDVVIARNVLDEQQAGLYAGGLILTKAVLFLPQFVVVIVFPSMSSVQSARRMNLKALGIVLAIGAATVVGAAVLSGLAVTFVGGPQYAELQNLLWVFAGLGTLLAMLQLMVYNVVARQRQRAVFAIWTALVLLVLTAAFTGSVRDLVLTVLAVDAVLFAVLLLRAGARSRRTSADGPLADLVRGLVPATTGSHRDVERHGELGRGGHLSTHELLEAGGLPRRNLEHELVVNLQQHP